MSKVTYTRDNKCYGRLFLDGEMIGWLYFYGNDRHYGYRLSSNQHKLSQRWDDLKKMLKEIERKSS